MEFKLYMLYVYVYVCICMYSVRSVCIWICLLHVQYPF